MKKSLFAVAAVTAFAGAAQAQSSVTVYGIVDVGFTSTSARAASTKTTENLFGQSQESSSRLGFKGTEDLGGGTSAFFTVETGLTPEASNASAFNNRQSFVGMKKNGIGAASIGTQYTVVHNAVSATDPGASNNTVGSVIRPIGGTTAGSSSAGQYGASTAYTVSTTNMLIANSDKFAGFGVNAMYVQNGKNTTQTAATYGGTTNFSGWGVSADYTWKKLYATAAYQSFKQESDTTGTTLGTSPNLFASTTTVGSSTNNTDNQVYGAATYDFGILKAYANYVNRKVTSSINSNEYLKRAGQQIGVRSYITPAIESWASIGNGRVNAYGANQPTANFVAWQLGTNYYLSKRTNLYGIYGQNNTSSTSGNLGGSAASQFAVGVRHTF